MARRQTKQQQFDVAIVGGGPCGLALAKGLLDLNYSVVVVEKEDADAVATQHDWSKAYSYRVEARGIALMKRIGVFDKMEERSVPKHGMSVTSWLPDGSLVPKAKRTGGSAGYWLQRPHIIEFLQELLPDKVVIQGQVNKITLDESSVATLNLDSNNGTIQAKYVFGCDGVKSIVRQTLHEMDDSFQIHKIPSPSAGLVFRATLIEPPVHLDPQESYNVENNENKQLRLTMLPFRGKPGEFRPIACAREPSNVLFQLETPEQVYDFFDKHFPQLGVRQRLPRKSAEAWCTTQGSTFPVPRLAGKAVIRSTGGVVMGILGDALHCFPPDLGLGVNSGLADVNRVLDFMQQQQQQQQQRQQQQAASPDSVNALNQVLVDEARAICQMIPIGFPYQYTLPHSLQKVVFYGDFFTRFFLHKGLQCLSDWTGIPNPLYPPVVIQMQQDDPPLRFTTIVRNHHTNSIVIGSAVTFLLGAGVSWVSRWRSLGT